jgi:protein TonB
MVVPAALSAERLPAPPARGPRVPVALSLALHGLAIVPFLLAGMSGSSASDDEPALMVELSLAAPTAGPTAEADQPETPSEPQQQPGPPTPPVEQAEATPEPVSEPPPPPQEVAAAEPEIKLDLPPPDEPPPPTAAEMKPVAPPNPTPKPPKPKPAAAPRPTPAAAPRPTAQAAVTKAASPDVGNASITQQQAASAALVVFEGKPRFRIPPTPAVYPPRSIELGQQGEVMVRVRLQPDGTAAEILVWRSSNFPLLDRAALTAVRGWHFLPALRDGRPVAAWVEIPVRFRLH